MKHFPEDKCSLKQAEAEKPRSMTLRDVTGVFIVLCTGLVLSHLVLGLEVGLNYTRQCRNTKTEKLRNCVQNDMDREAMEAFNMGTTIAERNKVKRKFSVLGQLARNTDQSKQRFALRNRQE